MCRLLKAIIWLVLVALSSCTDLAAVYRQEILLLRNADKITPESAPLSLESLVMPLPESLTYPIGLTYDSQDNRLFVAEAVYKASEVVSLALGPEYEVKAMNTVVKSENTSVIEGMTYDPRSQQLYWTDSFNHGVFKANISTELKDDVALEPRSVHNFGNVIQPRGIALDYCNGHIYWSERDSSDQVPSSVEMCDLDGSTHFLVQQDKDMNIYYQGMTFDISRGILLWAQTVGDEYHTSSCHIMSSLSKMKEPQEVLVLDNCYPFSLTVDENYIYWADWGRQGIMRASLTDPKDVVKLVHTPAINHTSGQHHGAYGLTQLNGPSKQSLQDSCKASSDITTPLLQETENKSSSDESSDVNIATSDNQEYDSSDLSLAMNDQEIEVENLTMEPSEVDVGKENLNENVKQSSDDEVALKLLPLQDHNIAVAHPADKNRSRSPVLEETSVEMTSISSAAASDLKIHRLQNSPSDSHSPTSAQETSSLVKEEMCNEYQLLWIIVVLAVLCAVFMASTIFLLVKYTCKKNSEDCKTLITTVNESHEGISAKPSRQVKRFGPKKRYDSGNKSGFNGTSPCSGLATGDGVTINIEDCCQMTLCETPCYTSVKKEGKSYKSANVHTKRCEDRRGLLDDCEDI